MHPQNNSTEKMVLSGKKKPILKTPAHPKTADGGPRKQSGDPTLDILLAELNIIANRWEHSDQIAESRLNILLTSTSGATAILILLDQLGIESSNILEVSGIIFLIIWMLGILTFTRMVERNSVATQSNRAMNRIRKYFIKQQPQILSYLNIPKEEAPQNPKGNRAVIRFLGSRTLAAVISSIAFGMLTKIVILLLSKQVLTDSIQLILSLALGIVHFATLEWYAVVQLKKL